MFRLVRRLAVALSYVRFVLCLTNHKDQSGFRVMRKNIFSASSSRDGPGHSNDFGPRSNSFDVVGLTLVFVRNGVRLRVSMLSKARPLGFFPKDSAGGLIGSYASHLDLIKLSTSDQTR